jgi:hypothetical protein
MRTGRKAGTTTNNCTVKRNGGLGSAKQLLIIMHEFSSHFLKELLRRP